MTARARLVAIPLVALALVVGSCCVATPTARAHGG